MLVLHLEWGANSIEEAVLKFASSHWLLSTEESLQDRRMQSMQLFGIKLDSFETAEIRLSPIIEQDDINNVLCD